MSSRSSWGTLWTLGVFVVAKVGLHILKNWLQVIILRQGATHVVGEYKVPGITFAHPGEFFGAVIG
tara:strand:+ start:904 stop:1101 length:198 start_codon:yes stop_codon:yes gene_type:complete